MRRRQPAEAFGSLRIDRSTPGFAGSELRDAERVAVGILEPGNPATGRRFPDAALVLPHPGVAFELDPGAPQLVDGRRDIRNTPAENGVLGRGHLLHRHDAQHDAVGIEHEREVVLGLKDEAKRLAIEDLRANRILRRDERHDVAAAQSRSGTGRPADILRLRGASRSRTCLRCFGSHGFSFTVTIPSFGTSSLLATIEPTVAMARTVGALPSAERGTPTNSARCARSTDTLTPAVRFVMFPRPIDSLSPTPA